MFFTKEKWERDKDYYYYYLLVESFSHQRLLMVFYWSLSNSKSPQVSRTLLNILADHNNPVVWMVSSLPLISKSSSPFINPLVVVPRAQITTGINITFMFHSFFNPLARSRYSSFFSLSFSFIQLSIRTWSFAGVWMTVSLLSFPGLFSVFRLISITLQFGWYRLFLWFPILLVPFGDRSKCTNYNWYYRHLHVPQLY